MSDGEEAVAAIRRGAVYDLILMNFEMPGINGLDATAESASGYGQAPPSHPPIIAFTAHAIQSRGDACLAAGMDARLSKPIEVEKLKRMLANHACRATKTDSKRIALTKAR